MVRGGDTLVRQQGRLYGWLEVEDSPLSLPGALRIAWRHITAASTFSPAMDVGAGFQSTWHPQQGLDRGYEASKAATPACIVEGKQIHETSTTSAHQRPPAPLTPTFHITPPPHPCHPSVAAHAPSILPSRRRINPPTPGCFPIFPSTAFPGCRPRSSHPDSHRSSAGGGLVTAPGRKGGVIGRRRPTCLVDGGDAKFALINSCRTS